MHPYQIYRYLILLCSYLEKSFTAPWTIWENWTVYLQFCLMLNEIYMKTSYFFLGIYKIILRKKSIFLPFFRPDLCSPIKGMFFPFVFFAKLWLNTNLINIGQLAVIWCQNLKHFTINLLNSWHNGAMRDKLIPVLFVKNRLFKLLTLVRHFSKVLTLFFYTISSWKRYWQIENL